MIKTVEWSLCSRFIACLPPSSLSWSCTVEEAHKFPRLLSLQAFNFPSSTQYHSNHHSVALPGMHAFGLLPRGVTIFGLPALFGAIQYKYGQCTCGFTSLDGSNARVLICLIGVKWAFGSYCANLHMQNQIKVLIMAKVESHFWTKNLFCCLPAQHCVSKEGR